MNIITQSIIDSVTQLDNTLADAQAKIIALQTTINVGKTFSALERSAWILAPGTVGNTGSTGSAADGKFTPPDTSCAAFGLTPHGAYANRYWYKQFGADATKTKYRYEASILFASDNDSKACQTVELDIQQVVAKSVFNPALQLDFAEGLIRIWNRSIGTQGQWESTGVALSRLQAMKWSTIILEAHRENNTIIHDIITVDTLATKIKAKPFPIKIENKSDMINCGFQLDGNQLGTSYKVYVDNVNFTVS